MKIGLITTLHTNIGDDFIREGICYLLREVFKGERIEFVSVNKHKPYTIYPTWHPIHLRDLADRLPFGHLAARNAVDDVFAKMGFSRFDDCDLIVQCGAPVFWPHCSQNEWAKPIWHEVVGRLSGKIPVLNVAAGSCYPWERQPENAGPPEDEEYIRSILGYCRLTTVRDRLAERICRSVGREVPLIPCSAFFAWRGKTADLKCRDTVLINYMAGGGHYDFGQQIDLVKWENTIRELISHIRKTVNVAFLCHDEKEESLAKAMDPSLPRFLPRNPREYFEIVSRAITGCCSRMHASVGMAGIGIPTIAVCSDTRLLMAEEVGLRSYYVKDVTADMLKADIDHLVSAAASEQERLLELQTKTMETYIRVIRDVMP